MGRLREAIRQKRTEFWKNQSWILHHDCTSAHTSMLVPEFLAKNKTIIMPQSLYSPDLASADIFLFPKLKTPMNGKSCATIKEIKEKSTQELLFFGQKQSFNHPIHRAWPPLTFSSSQKHFATI